MTSSDSEPKYNAFSSVENQQRIAEIVRLKTSFKYTPRTTERLAREWGLSLGYVKNLAVEANKIVRKQLCDPNEIAALVVPGLRKVFRHSVREKDSRGSAAVARELLSLGDLKINRHEISGRDGKPIEISSRNIDLTKLSTEQLELIASGKPIESVLSNSSQSDSGAETPKEPELFLRSRS